MTDRDAVLDTLSTIVARVLGSNRMPPGARSADTPLTEGGLWLDSVDLLEVIVACETEFDVTFEPARDLVGDALRTLGTLAAVIHARNPALARAPSPAPESS